MSKKTKRTISDDVPFTTMLPDGRTLFVLIPARWCEVDVTGEIVFSAAAARFLDRVRAMAMPAKSTAGYIRSLREALGLTQEQFGRKLGVSKMTVARWEWGKVQPRPQALKSIEQLRRAAGRRGTVIAA